MNDENAAELLDTESCVMSDESIQAQQQLRQHLLSSSSASSSAATALLSTESYSPTPESVEHRRKLLLQSHRSSSSSISPSSKSSSISSAASADAPPTPRPLMSRVRVAVDHIVIESTSNCSRDSVEHVVNANSSGAAAPALSPCRRLEPLVVTQSSVLFGRDASLYRILDSDARDDALLVVFPFPEFVEPSPPHCSVAGVGTQMAALNDKPSQPHTQFYVRLCASNGQSVRARLARVAMGEDNARLYGVEHLDAFVLVGNQRRVLVNFHPTTVALGGSRVQINTGYYRGQYNLAQSGAVVGEKVLLHVSWRGMMLPGSPFSVVVTEPSMPPAVFDDPSQWSVTNEGSSSCWQVDRSMAVVHFWHCATPRDVGGAHRSGDVDFIGVEVRGKRAVALNDANIFALGDESALLILLYEQSARALRQMAPSVVRAECISLHRRTAAAVFVFRHARMRAEKRVLKVVAFRAGMLEVKGHIERFAHSRDDVVALHAVHQEPPESDVVPEFIGLELQFAPYTFADVFRGYLAKIREPALATIGTSSGDSSPNTDANVAAARAALRRHDAYVLHVVRRVLEIVEQLHRRGLVHCDIKESNVAVWLNTAPWTVKLLDLESVREMQASTPELAPAPQFIAQTGRRGSSSSQLSARSSKSGPDSGGATPVSDSISATPSYWPSEVPTFAANAMPAVDLYAIAHVLFNCLVDQTLPTFHVAAAWNRAGVNAKKRSAPPPSDKPAPKAVADALAVAKAEPVWYVSKWRRFLAALGGGYDESGAGRMLGALDRLSRDGLPDWLAMPHILASCIGGFEPADVLYFVATHSRVAAAARRGPSLASMYGFKDELNGFLMRTRPVLTSSRTSTALSAMPSRGAHWTRRPQTTPALRLLRMRSNPCETASCDQATATTSSRRKHSLQGSCSKRQCTRTTL
jgi:serine/threonine protein kinase